MDEEQVIPAPEAPEPDNQELSSMNKLLLPLFIFLLLVVIAGIFFIRAQRESSLPSPTPTLEATPLESPSPEVSPTGSPKASPSPTPTKSPSPTPTKSPTSSPTS